VPAAGPPVPVFGLLDTREPKDGLQGHFSPDRRNGGRAVDGVVGRSVSGLVVVNMCKFTPMIHLMPIF
jgi:hypothetical protein